MRPDKLSPPARPDPFFPVIITIIPAGAALERSGAALVRLRLIRARIEKG